MSSQFPNQAANQRRKANVIPSKPKNCAVCLAEFNRIKYKCGQQESRKKYEERTTCCELCARIQKNGKADPETQSAPAKADKASVPPPPCENLPQPAPLNAQYMVDLTYFKVTNRGVFRHDGYEWVKSTKTPEQLYAEVRRLRLAA